MISHVNFHIISHVKIHVSNSHANFTCVNSCGIFVRVKERGQHIKSSLRCQSSILSNKGSSTIQKDINNSKSRPSEGPHPLLINNRTIIEFGSRRI